MARFHFSKRALADLDDIVEYTIHKWGVEQANKYARMLEAECDRLVERPRAGRACDQIRPGLWRAKAGSHILFFRRNDAAVLICRILHYRMLPEHQPIDDADTSDE